MKIEFTRIPSAAVPFDDNPNPDPNADPNANPDPNADPNANPDPNNPPAVDVNSKEFKDAVAAAVESSTKGLVENRDKILSELKAEKEKTKEFQEKWGDLDHEAIKSLLDKSATDEEAALIAAGKTDEVIEKRTAKLREKYEKEITDLTKERDELKVEKVSLETKISNHIIDTQVSAAAAEAGVVATAVKDTLSRAREVFTIEEDGSVVAKDSAGAVILGPDAKTPLTVKEWVEGMKKDAPHFFPPSEGTGSEGGPGTGSETDVKITMEEAQDNALYQKRKKLAEERGVKLIVT